MRALIGGWGIGGPPVLGVTVAELDGPASTVVGTAADTAVDPAYLAVSGDRVYVAESGPAAVVSAWCLTGEPQLLGSVPAEPSQACFIAVHPARDVLLTASYRGGAIAVMPILSDGVPAAPTVHYLHNGQAQESHPHMLIPESGTDRLLATDLGTDRVLRFRLTENGELSEPEVTRLRDGTGPRHLVVDGSLAYVAGELDSSLTVLDLATSPPVVMATYSTVAARTGEPSYPSAIRMHPQGGFCYVANRGPDTIAVFAVDGRHAELIGTVHAGGSYPWDLLLADDYLYVANQRSDSLVVFVVDSATGIPEPTGVSLSVRSPTCIAPVRIGRSAP